MGSTGRAPSAEPPSPPDFPREIPPSSCPIEDWLAFLGHRWNALVLWHLGVDTRRHGELAKMLPGISSKVLAERLAALERRGLVSRQVTEGFPRAVTYCLTDAGRRLLPVLVSLESWERSLPALDAAYCDPRGA